MDFLNDVAANGLPGERLREIAKKCNAVARETGAAQFMLLENLFNAVDYEWDEQGAPAQSIAELNAAFAKWIPKMLAAASPVEACKIVALLEADVWPVFSRMQP